MRTSIQILPGIKSIGWIDCRTLPRRVDLSAICGMPLAIMTDVHPIEFFGDPTCECKSKKDSAGYEDTATLKFSTGTKFPRGVPLGFIVTDVNGRSYLIGSLEAPRPKVEIKHSTGTPSGDRAGFDYEVTHVAIKTMIGCIV